MVRKSWAGATAISFPILPSDKPFYGHEVLQVAKQPDEREIPSFPSACPALLPVVKVWEISSLLCSRNCALREAEDVAYTILYIALYGHRRNRKLKSNYKLKNSKTIMEKKEMYLAPEVEVLEVQVEKGFAATGGDDYTEVPPEI